jgi:hypothetical protein
MSSEERQKRLEYLLSIPWIKELPASKRGKIPCNGIRWSKVSFKSGTKNAHCKRMARFHYTSGRKKADRFTYLGYKITGDYCWSHVVALIGDHDYYRYDDWRKSRNESADTG